MLALAATLNHFRAVKHWCERHGARARLDMVSHELEVRLGTRIFNLFPQFYAKREGLRAHVPILTNETTGFIGWMPYKPIAWPLSTDKALGIGILKAFFVLLLTFYPGK